MFQIRGMCFSNRLTILKVIKKVRHSCVIIGSNRILQRTAQNKCS